MFLTRQICFEEILKIVLFWLPTVWEFIPNLSVLCGFTNILVIRKLVGEVDVLFLGDRFLLCDSDMVSVSTTHVTIAVSPCREGKEIFNVVTDLVKWMTLLNRMEMDQIMFGRRARILIQTNPNCSDFILFAVSMIGIPKNVRIVFDIYWDITQQLWSRTQAILLKSNNTESHEHRRIVPGNLAVYLSFSN